MRNAYDVDRIIGRRTSLCRGIEYLIMWLGYPLDHCTWEPVKQLTCSAKIADFELRCFQLRLEQQHHAKHPTVDLYENHGVVSLVEEGHEYMMTEDSGFESPPEDFDFVGDGTTTICDGGGRVYYLVHWSDEAASWEAPSGFVEQQAAEVLTKFENAQFAQERKALCKRLQREQGASSSNKKRVAAIAMKSLSSGPSGGVESSAATFDGPPDPTSIPASAGGDCGQWFNLKSSNLAPIAPLAPAAKISPVTLSRRIVTMLSDDDDDDDGSEGVVSVGRSASVLSSSSESARPLEHILKRKRKQQGAASQRPGSGGSLPLVTRRMAETLVDVYIDHSEGEELLQRKVSRRAMLRMARERKAAREALRRVADGQSRSEIVAQERVVSARQATPSTPPPPPKVGHRPMERGACNMCQLDTRPDAWGCVECRLWFHRACYSSLVTRFGATAEYLEALEDDDGSEFVCLFCSRYSRRTFERALTWRGTDASAVSSRRVNMAGIDVIVKWKGMAYRHLDWVPFMWLQVQPSLQQRCMRLKLQVTTTPEPPQLETTFEQSFLVPAAIIGARLYAQDVERQRLKELHKKPPSGVAEDEWGLYAASETVWVVWRGQGASNATWETPPSPYDGAAEYLAWHTEFVSWQQAEKVSLVKHRQLVKSTPQREFSEFRQQPDFIRGGTLYPYQLDGANWLWYKWHSSGSGVLADEMGLGKTVQAIAFLLMVFHSTLGSRDDNLNRGTFPFLVVAPTTLVSNWAQELRTWAPGLVVAQLSGCADDRAVELEHTIFRCSGRGGRGAVKDLKCHVVLASYEAISNQSGIRELMSGNKWEAIVCDEGHRLKNDQAKTYMALQLFEARTRIVLTGTLVQNDLRELSSVLSFVDPGNAEVLSTLSQLFQDGSAECVARIHEVIRPYILRRTKEDVPRLVPAKHEVILPVSMTGLQRSLYRATLTKNVRMLQSIAAALHQGQALGGGSGGETRVGSRSLNNTLMEVRMLVSHPYNLDNVEPTFESKEETQAQLIAAGGKLRLLHTLLPELQRRGHRILLFSQFKRTLTILEDYLAAEGIGYARIDGDTPSRLRQSAVDDFNAPGSPLLVFLLSTRTGGTGLNLTSADVVIVYDCDFNPQADIQAVGRAHRIGQTKPVTVLKLVTENSAEERIVRRATRKLLIDHLVIGNLSAVDDSAAASSTQASPAPPQADIEAALRCDARLLFDEATENGADDRAIVYDRERVSALLDQCQVALAEEAKRLETSADGPARKSAFGVARVWAMDRDGRLSDIANDPESMLVGGGAEKSGDDVWARLLKQTGVATNDDSEEAAGGDGPRLRVRKQKVDYALKADDRDNADVDDESVAGDDNYTSGSDVARAVSPRTPGVAVVRRDELVDVVQAYTNTLVANYDASPRGDPALLPANWNHQIGQAFVDLFRPLASCTFTPTTPALLFRLPTDLRLRRGTNVPPQAMDCCPLCCLSVSHGTGYCPRICDPQLMVTVARVKQIPEYWAHPVFKAFVCWYTVQYVWYILGDPRGLIVNERNVAMRREYVASAEPYVRDVRNRREASRRAEKAAARNRLIVSAAGKRVAPALATMHYATVYASTQTAGSGIYNDDDAVQPMPVSGESGPYNPYVQFLAALREKGHRIPSDLAATRHADLPALRSAAKVLATAMADLHCTAEKEFIRLPVNKGEEAPEVLKRMVRVVYMASEHIECVRQRIAQLVATPVTLPPAAPALVEVAAMEVDSAEVAPAALEHHPAPMDVVVEPSATPSESEADDSTGTYLDSVVPSVNGDSQFDEPSPVMHALRMGLGKLMQLQGYYVTACSSGQEPSDEIMRSVQRKVDEMQAMLTQALLAHCRTTPKRQGMAPLLQHLDQLNYAQCSTPAGHGTKSAAISKCLSELLLWVKASVRDVMSVTPTPSGYRVAIELADTEALPVADIVQPSPDTEASTSVVLPAAPLPSPKQATTPAVDQSSLPFTLSSIGVGTGAARESLPVLATQAKPILHRPPPHSRAMSTANHSLTQNVLGLVPSTSPPMTAPASVQRSEPIVTTSSPPCHVSTPPPLQQQQMTSAATHQYRPLISLYGPWPHQPQQTPNDLATSLAREYANAHAEAGSRPMTPLLLPRQTVRSQQPRPPVQQQFHQTQQRLRWEREQQVMWSEWEQQQQRHQQWALMAHHARQLYPHFNPHQLQALLANSHGQGQQPAGRFPQPSPVAAAPLPQQLVTPITANYGLMSQQPVSAGIYSSHRTLNKAGPMSSSRVVSPPVYVESMGGMATTCDMVCVLCGDPMHAPASCPYANNVDYLTLRRVSIKKSTNLPPNMMEVMLTTLDKYLRLALDQN
ncbi:hypothetical protein GGI20_002688 [Coemansia sp. BCRC 34301]|nr:hypothetical protein GGI20_002688 [Coemansia sp. BCRC 34301]